MRRKMKARQRMKRAQKKAEVIFGADGISNKVKAHQIQKLYAKQLAAIRKERNKKEYRVMKKKSSKAMGFMKTSRNVKMVDKRMKADKRGKKIAEKRGRKKRKLTKYRGRRNKSGRKNKRR